MSDVDCRRSKSRINRSRSHISCSRSQCIFRRGTKVFEAGFTGDNLLDEDIKTFLGNWKPDLTIIEWNGEYDIK